jgi:hypothetical protein
MWEGFFGRFCVVDREYDGARFFGPLAEVSFMSGWRSGNEASAVKVQQDWNLLERGVILVVKDRQW